MKNKIKAIRIIGVCLAILVVILGIGHLMIDRIAGSQFRKALAGFPGQIDFQGLHVSLMAGDLELKDVEITLQDSTNTVPNIQGSIKAIKLEGLSWSALTHGEANAKRLIIRNPHAQVVLPAKTEEKKDTAAAPAQDSFMKKVSVSEICIEKGAVGLSSLANPMKVSAKGIHVSVNDIRALLAENRVEYNDSIYRFALDSLDIIDETGLSRIRIGHLSTADAGPVEALALHLYSDVPQEALAVKLGKVSAMWYDIKLDSLYTSPLNLPRLAGSEQIDVDQIHLSGPAAVLLQDDRFPPKVPYTTLQEGINSLTTPLHVHQLDARFKSFTFIWETTHVNRGTFEMKNLRTSLKSVSNAHGNMMDMDVKAGLPGKSRMDLALHIRNDKQESTHGRMQIFNLDASRLDPFLRPLFGATVKADLHHIDCHFKGNKHKLNSNFCMLYDNLELKAWKDTNAPFEIVSKHSKTVTFLANLAIWKSNPAHAGKEPKKVEFDVERNPMQPYPTYIIQNLETGMMLTVLPGSAVHKKK